MHWRDLDAVAVPARYAFALWTRFAVRIRGMQLAPTNVWRVVRAVQNRTHFVEIWFAMVTKIALLARRTVFAKMVWSAALASALIAHRLAMDSIVATMVAVGPVVIAPRKRSASKVSAKVLVTQTAPTRSVAMTAATAHVASAMKVRFASTAPAEKRGCAAMAPSMTAKSARTMTIVALLRFAPSVFA